MKPSNDIVAEYSKLAAVGNRCLSHLLLSSTCRTRMRGNIRSSCLKRRHRRGRSTAGGCQPATWAEAAGDDGSGSRIIRRTAARRMGNGW